MKQSFYPYVYIHAWSWYSIFGNQNEIQIYSLGSVFSLNSLRVLVKAQNLGMTQSWRRKSLVINLPLKSTAKDFYCWSEINTSLESGSVVPTVTGFSVYS